jgi:phenol 2-monooxygenase
VSYDKDGNELQGRGWYFMENMKDTQWDFALVLRQKYREELLRRRLRELEVNLEMPVELVRIDVHESLPQKGDKITAVTRNGVIGEEETIISKYLVGADGGRTFVRRALYIPFDGNTTEDKWVRIDGIVETNMPKSRVYGTIESPTHGNVLWAALDHGATRIGFAFTAERQTAYPEFKKRQLLQGQ